MQNFSLQVKFMGTVQRLAQIQPDKYFDMSLFIKKHKTLKKVGRHAFPLDDVKH